MEELRSCIYECHVAHCRIKPKRNSFSYRYFMFFIDLDELDSIRKKCSVFSNEKSNLYSFRKKDHFLNSQNTKDSILQKFSEAGITGNLRIFLLTNLRVAGYQFNPVSFYFAVEHDIAKGCIAEVGNTFGEQKLYHIQGKEGKFKELKSKQFYVSPFSPASGYFDFEVSYPNDKLHIRINSADDSGKLVVSTLLGEKKSLTTKNVIGLTIRYPLVTLKVISLIHFQAAKLWIKRLPHFNKTKDKQNQLDLYKLNK